MFHSIFHSFFPTLLILLRRTSVQFFFFAGTCLGQARADRPSGYICWSRIEVLASLQLLLKCLAASSWAAMNSILSSHCLDGQNLHPPHKRILYTNWLQWYRCFYQGMDMLFWTFCLSPVIFKSSLWKSLKYFLMPNEKHEFLIAETTSCSRFSLHLSLLDWQLTGKIAWSKFALDSRLTFLQCVAGMIVSTLARDFITDETQNLELRLEVQWVIFSWASHVKSWLTKQ